MSVDPHIRRLRAVDADALIALRREALETEPLAFGASPEDDVGLVLESVRTFLGNHEQQAVFGQFDGADLIGMGPGAGARCIGKGASSTSITSFSSSHERNPYQHRAGRALLQHAAGEPFPELKSDVTPIREGEFP